VSREQDILGIVEYPIRDFKIAFGKEPIVSIPILDECFIKVEEILERGFDPVKDVNEFKFAGVICFWLRKLKPFRLESKKGTILPVSPYVNEVIALLTAYQFIFGYFSIERKDDKDFHLPKLTPRYFSDLVTSIRYNSYSPHSLVNIFESLSI